MDKVTFKHFKSLEELPAWNFYMVRKTEDLRYLIKSEDYFDLDSIPEATDNLKIHWEKLFDQYIDTFSISKEYEKILMLRRDITISEAQFAMTENRKEKNTIRRLKRELQDLTEPKESGKSLTFEEQVIQLENHRKIGIESLKITCMRFFTLRKHFLEEARKNQIARIMSNNG